MGRGRHKQFGRRNTAGKPLSKGLRYVTGRHVIEELLAHSPERIVKVFVVENAQARGKGEGARKRDLLFQLKDIRKEVQELSFDELSALVGTTSHQGFAAIVHEREAMDLSEFFDEVREKDNSLVLILDEINDPQNLGALLRVAECFGVDAVIWSKNRGVDVTPVVSKASVGASEIVPIIRVSNLNDAAKKLKDEGYWVAAAVINEKAKSLHEFETPKKIALIVGSEGEGIGRLLGEVSDYLLYIPLEGKIQSLNVSQATAILLYELRRQIKKCF
ncbi:MAG: 23S rRNA (guanosine(2251)-2'-O)-methyltransferase RlmB [SAR324 cluster bacterium]|uniref:23S rRNA (Guanosine(2251)-2'-O)-methyltransferase RlmB n=1 Tax=SAR324 cluster bacterium TaxID=2024889 RepID=A0A7X9FTE9_9DELT|nr:23S rRNA (guanosine(2251)-2'-O)-methyltransferase RlmB [SAR324 cluster bacterium]